MRDWGTLGIDGFVELNHDKIYPDIEPTQTTLPPSYTVCVIGASRGIGAGIAYAYAQAGASTIILASRNTTELFETASRCRSANANIQVRVTFCDITSTEDVSNLGEIIERKYGRLDAVLINSGYSGPVVLDVAQADPATWKNVTEVNYLGTYHACTLPVASAHQVESTERSKGIPRRGQ